MDMTHSLGSEPAAVILCQLTLSRLYTIDTHGQLALAYPHGCCRVTLCTAAGTWICHPKRREHSLFLPVRCCRPKMK